MIFSSIARKFALLALLPVLLCACEPTIATRGNILDKDKIAKIEIGKSSRQDVIEELGSPTQVATFDENVWYYVGRSTEQYSFMDPEIVQQKALEVRFDKQGIVTSMRDFKPSLAQNITPSSDETPTYGHETTFFEQLLGNLGRPGNITGQQRDRD